MLNQGWTLGSRNDGAARSQPLIKWVARRLWSALVAGLSYVVSVRFEYKSLAVIGASVMVLYVLALSNPAEPKFGADTAIADSEKLDAAKFSAATPTAGSPRTPSVATQPESLTALIIGKNTALKEAQPLSVASLVDFYQEIDYRLDGIRLGKMTVPRVLVNRLPDDFSGVSSPTERKNLFIKLALPLILHANERITADRDRLVALRKKFEFDAIDSSERLWLDGLADRYGLDTFDLDALMQRVDVIPPSLALAQGAEESGWGTSRFVREGNAIFGQRTFKQGTGLVPNQRDPNETYEVKAFTGLMESVASYMTNLNTHDAYDEFRRIRAGQRAAGDVVDSDRLVGALNRYSERGDDYIKTIRSIMNKNELRSFDQAQFDLPDTKI